MNPELLKSQEEILRDGFEQWRQHPITNQLIKCIKKHRDSFADTLARSGMEMNEAQLKAYCANMKNCDAIAKMLVDFNTFKEQVNKQ